MYRHKIASSKPTRQEIEKVAQEIVIHVKRTGDDPYSVIKSTGFSDNILETLLKKFNIFNFLQDALDSNVDPHNRDVGLPPLELDKLFNKGQSCGCGGETPVGTGAPSTNISRVEGPGVSGIIVKKRVSIPLSQSADTHDLTKIDLDKKELPPSIAAHPSPEEKSALEQEFELLNNLPTNKLKNAIAQIDNDIYIKTHQYCGGIRKLAYFISDISHELAKCHSESPITRHIFQTAGVDMPSIEQKKWNVQSNEKLASLVSELEKDLSYIEKQAEAKSLLKTIISQRKG